MCVIIDACLAGQVFARPCGDEFRPLWAWLRNTRDPGCIVYGGQLAEELLRIRGAREGGEQSLKRLKQAGRAHEVSKEGVAAEEKKVKSLRTPSGRKSCRSDDPHVIALARLSGARVLCSADQTLHADFKNPDLVPRPRGRVYQNANHAHLLHHDVTCVGRRRQ